MSKVSAIISAYYAEQYLSDRLENLISQKVKEGVEIITVLQEGSKEESIYRDFVSSREDILLGKSVSRENRVRTGLVLTPDIPTVYAAWNLGIESATGDYVTNANSDDRLYPGALAKLAKALDDHPKYSVAYSDADVVEQIGGPPVARYEWAEGSIEQLLQGCFLGPWPMWRRKLHDKYGLFDGEMHSAGDYEFWLRLAKAGEKFFHVREVTGAYLRRDDSAEHRHKLRSIWEQARAKGRYREGVNELWTKPEPMTG